MNILFSCAGRRNYLLDYFRASIGKQGRILATDASPNAPALFAADQCFIVPKVQAPNYIEHLLQLCLDYKVDLVVSLNDLELPILAAAKARFSAQGTTVLVSEKKVIDLCFDKYQTAKYLSSLGLPTLATYLTVDEVKHACAVQAIKFPVIVKPRWGSASIGIELASNEAELDLAYAWVKNKIARSILNNVGNPEHAIIIQPYLQGVEYGIDIVNNFNCKTEAVFIKQKLAMRAGETDRAITVSKPDIEKLCYRLGNSLAHIGNLDCDLFEVDGLYYFLELNPRFGGGYPFSQLAGANIPAAVLAWLEGTPPDPAWLKVKSQVSAAKYDNLCITQG